MICVLFVGNITKRAEVTEASNMEWTEEKLTHSNKIEDAHQKIKGTKNVSIGMALKIINFSVIDFVYSTFSIFRSTCCRAHCDGDCNCHSSQYIYCISISVTKTSKHEYTN